MSAQKQNQEKQKEKTQKDLENEDTAMQTRGSPVRSLGGFFS